MLKEGENGHIILGKGTILYHCDDGSLNFMDENKMLFCTMNTYLFDDEKKIYKILLKKDMILLFAFDEVKIGTDRHTSSVFNDIRENWKKRLLFINELINEGFDGWFSTIEGSSHLEICLCFEKYRECDLDIEFIDSHSMPKYEGLNDVKTFNKIIDDNIKLIDCKINCSVKVCNDAKNFGDVDQEKKLKIYKKRYRREKKLFLSNYKYFINVVFLNEYIIFPYFDKKFGQ